jgi:hypothetical protein
MKPEKTLLALTTAALIPGAAATSEWPLADDIPVAEPITVGLAGERPADIVRYLLAEGARSAYLSQDGHRLAFEWAVTGEPQVWSSTPREGGRGR